MSHSDEMWMEEALREAHRALALGEVPVGAVVVRDGQSSVEDVIGRSAPTIPRRMPKSWRCARPGKALGNYRLLDCDLYVTVEPCAMCAGAITHARIRRLIYGAEDAKAGAVHSMLQVLNHPKLNHTG